MSHNEQLIDIAAHRLCDLIGFDSDNEGQFDFAKSHILDMLNNIDNPAYKAIQYATNQLEEDKS